VKFCPRAGCGHHDGLNNLTEHDHIAICASGFGGGGRQVLGVRCVFHFDTSNQTLYFSADGTQASVIMVALVQAGVTINNPHDLLMV
jgi:hypothetical protein